MGGAGVGVAELEGVGGEEVGEYQGAYKVGWLVGWFSCLANLSF